MKQEMSQYEVARELGITRASVAELERKAMAKVRRIFASRGLRLEDYIDVTKKRRRAK